MKNPLVQAVMWKCLSSNVITYIYIKSPCIFRKPGGGFHADVVSTLITIYNIIIQSVNKN